MLLGYNTNGLQNHRLPDALHLLADNGYRAVALTLDVQHLDPFRCTAREVDEVATLLQKLDLQPVIETGARFLLNPRRKHEPTLMTRAADGRATRLDFYARAARIGRDLGASVVSFWTGVDRGPAAETAVTLREGVAAACATIRDAGLVPALEPEPGMAVATVAEFLALRRDIGDAAPAVCLDVGHLYVTGEGLPGAIIPALKGLIAQVHLEDMRVGVHEHLLPGEGDVDFPAVQAALEEVDYAGPVCFELSRSSHLAPGAIQICRTVWESGHR